MPPCWFLAPDFTFTQTSLLRLGTILSSPHRPTLALATTHTGLPTSPPPPPHLILTELNHTHRTSAEAAAAHKLFARFLHASTSASASLRRARDFGTLDLELHTFAHEFSDEYLRATVAVPRVKRHVDGGFLRPRHVYVITGVRVAKTKLTVAWDAEGGAAVAGQVRVPVGGVGAEGGARFEVAGRHSFEAAEGVVFAYRVNVIRVRGEEVEEELFSHRAAFMTGAARGVGGPEWECVEGTEEVLRQGDEEEDDDEAVEMEMVDEEGGSMGFFAWAKGDAQAGSS
ncbi:hypothetical protein B0T18DRAFT_394432 [Schizothecium vesticola]|uniref:Uncharacterized protein n=1 Tax=Schizothecium vesticola TaxID=314040 RepID=A0AA40BPL5_9PEZI|nr:hypothetical protein B0T18DRAFT_394432 [Schizothecium vesticola]